ncbi:hypothetical protein [Telluribacter sp.]|jgi:hypothetical protein|uniref:hypothetical protein n=1 Tax=Telluribacter sp. TaxID=1978767 RepID=UPI002E15ED56|nr:hypothetical protein [Telluribacter sp.]
MGPKSNLQTIIDSKRYDLHGLQMTYRKAMESGDSHEAIEQLHFKILALKEEINSLVVVIDLPARMRNN